MRDWRVDFRTSPIAGVRKIERDLRIDVQKNKEQLRTLVGKSYRDLLRTTEKIIQMQGDTEKFALSLETLSRESDYAAFLNSAEASAQLQRNEAINAVQRLQDFAVIEFLRNCPPAIRTLQTAYQILSGAKLFGLANFISNSIASKGHNLKSVQKHLGICQTRIVTQIHEEFSRFTGSSNLSRCLCALAVASGGSVGDAIESFISIRLQNVSKESYNFVDFVERSMLVHDTIKKLRGLFPKELENSSRDAAAEVLADNAIQNIEGLNLATLKVLFPEEINTWTSPFDQSDAASKCINRYIEQWLTKSVPVLHHALDAVLSQTKSINEVMQGRKEVLHGLRYILDTLKVSDQSGMQELRHFFRRRGEQVLQERNLVKQSFAETCRRGLGTVDRTSIWDPSIESVDTNDGGYWFLQRVQRSTKGHDLWMSEVEGLIDAWVQEVRNESTLLKNIAQQRTSYALVDDESGVTYEKEDAEYLMELQSRLVQATSTELLDFICEFAKGCQRDSLVSLQLLQLVQLLRTRLSSLELSVWSEIEAARSSQLHAILVNYITSTAKRADCTRVTQAPSRAEMRMLRKIWTGTPALPMQPRPQIFAYLLELTQHFRDVDSRIMNPDAVQMLKGESAKLVSAALDDDEDPSSQNDKEPTQHGSEVTLDSNLSADGKTIEASNNVEQDTEEKQIPDDDTLQDRTDPSHPANYEGSFNPAGSANPLDLEKESFVQFLFDLHYLSAALHQTGDDAYTLSSSKRFQDIEKRSVLDVPLLEKLRTRASQYAKQTCLLTGLGV